MKKYVQTKHELRLTAEDILEMMREKYPAVPVTAAVTHSDTYGAQTDVDEDDPVLVSWETAEEEEMGE